MISEKGERPNYEGEVYQETIWEIIAGRQTGKTIFLIQASAKTGAVIVAPTYQMAKYIDHMARDLGLQIPPPITVADWIRGLVR